RHYRVGLGSLGYDDPSVQHVERAFAGVGLRPYAPVHLRSSRAVSGDLTVTWVRRSRIDADSWQGAEVPLGEEGESYLIRVTQGATVLAEATASSPSWTWTSAAQAGASGAVTISVAQISARFGPGLARSMAVTL
ncbi:MAG: host specificity protein, partial [Gemmobacter sp.]|nr:host specificity protein [Gemmobacter sp.]